VEDRDINAIEQHWLYSYNFFRNAVPPEQATKLANLAVPFMVDNWLSLQYPNVMDRAQAEFKAAYPDEKHIVVPVSDLIDVGLQKILNRKKDLFRF
jgi:hypothetical protein